MRRRGNSCGTELGIGARTGVTGVTGDRSSDVEGETGGEATGSGMERARDSRQDAVRRMGGSWRGLVWRRKARRWWRGAITKENVRHLTSRRLDRTARRRCILEDRADSGVTWARGGTSSEGPDSSVMSDVASGRVGEYPQTQEVQQRHWRQKRRLLI